jgi:endoribonuclease Dicer
VTLGTGAGKTFIAVLLIKEYAFQLLEAGKKAIFVVDKVALVGQQAEHIECHCSLAVGRVHGNTNKAWWSSRDDFSKFIQQYNVRFLTPQNAWIT